MAIRRLGRGEIEARGFRCLNGVTYIDNNGFPKSGTSGTTVNSAGNGVPTGSILIDKNTGVAFVNEGTSASPYWTPVDFQQRGLHGVYEDFRNGAGKADADTAATATLVRSGLRIHGQGIAETDSGVTVTMSSVGAVADAHTTDEDEHTIVLSMGAGTTAMMKPSVNGTMVLDVILTNSAAITERGMFVGFVNSAADALDPVANGATVTISFANTIADDIAGLFFDVGLTDGDKWFAIKDKANANASIATSATGVDTGVDVAAAGTYQRLRVEVDADGGVRMFIDKAQVASFAAATLTTTTAIHPIVQLIAEAASIKAMLVKQVAMWGVRP